ncbi:MAG: tetratricopeptide repeat protein [Candidatus Edwardsbacteria bacterium]|nr:tetratricopeptide repeat protein [Candidatus Edwardsbacteria bacterium]
MRWRAIMPGNMFARIFLRSWRPYVWLAGLAVVLYLPSVNHGFTGLDDEHLVLQNQRYIGDVRNAPLAFARDVYWRTPGLYYRPVLNLFLMPDAAVSGTAPQGYHLGNILWHALGCLALFAVLAAWSPGRGRAFVLSLLFACHPALTQAVAWIPGRNDLMLAAFALGSFRALMAALERGRPLALAVHVSLFALALFTKEAAAVLPLLFGLYAFLAAREKLRTRRFLIAACSWAVMLALWLAARSRAVAPGDDPVVHAFATAPEAALGLLSYLGKILFPFDLSVLPLAQDIQPWLGLAALAVLAAGAIAGGMRRPIRAVFGAAWFLLLLVPTFIKLNGQVNFLEHRLYLPLAGLLMMAAESALLDRFRPRAAVPVSVAVLMLFSYLTIRHERVFRDGLSFWSAAAAASPHSSLAFQMRGRMQERAGDSARAEASYRRSLANQETPSAHNDLGMLLLGGNRPAEAEHEFKAVLAADPRYGNVYNNLGLAQFNQGKLAEAERSLRAAIGQEPGRAESHDNLGVVLRQGGRSAEAELEFRTAITTDPRYPWAWRDLASLLLAQGRCGEAAALLDEGSARFPGDPVLRRMASSAFLRGGDLAAARARYRESVRLGLERDPAMEGSLSE